jgi:hypothetical protein
MLVVMVVTNQSMVNHQGITIVDVFSWIIDGDHWIVGNPGCHTNNMWGWLYLTHQNEILEMVQRTSTNLNATKSMVTRQKRTPGVFDLNVQKTPHILLLHE